MTNILLVTPTQAELQALNRENENLILLEYNEEQGMLHYNYGSQQPNTFGWRTLGLLEIKTADHFTDVLDVHRAARITESMTYEEVYTLFTLYVTIQLDSEELHQLANEIREQVKLKTEKYN